MRRTRVHNEHEEQLFLRLREKVSSMPRTHHIAIFERCTCAGQLRFVRGGRECATTELRRLLMDRVAHTRSGSRDLREFRTLLYILV